MDSNWFTVYSANNLLDIGIDWTSFEAGGDVYTDNGTWFVTPDDDQGRTHGVHKSKL